MPTNTLSSKDLDDYMIILLRNWLTNIQDSSPSIPTGHTFQDPPVDARNHKYYLTLYPSIY